ncbi:MAG: class I SAM-dependent methyltransferase [Stellaceae bacterium]
MTRTQADSSLTRRLAAEADRPDPQTGKEAGIAYAAAYVETHRTIDLMSLKIWNADLLLVDQLLSDYSLLDAGCGTGGDLRVLHNHRRVLAVDFSATMIAEAKILCARLDLRRIDFLVSRFEDLPEIEQFDVVRVRGIYGSYMPWPGHESAIDKVARLLKPTGLAISSYNRPRNALHTVKSKLLPKGTLAITEKAFMALWADRGFEHVLTIKPGNIYVAVFRFKP